MWTYSTSDGAKRGERLTSWCAEAERSGIQALQEFSAVPRGYTLQTQYADAVPDFGDQNEGSETRMQESANPQSAFGEC